VDNVDVGIVDNVVCLQEFKQIILQQHVNTMDPIGSIISPRRWREQQVIDA